MELGYMVMCRTVHTAQRLRQRPRQWPIPLGSVPNSIGLGLSSVSVNPPLAEKYIVKLFLPIRTLYHKWDLGVAGLSFMIQHLEILLTPWVPGYIGVFGVFCSKLWVWKYCNQQIMWKFEVINVNATGVPNLRFIETEWCLHSFWKGP